MKKIMFSFFALLFILNASAQFSFSLYGNYSFYKQQFKQTTKGFGAGLGYRFQEKMSLLFSYTNASPINIPNTVDVYSANGDEKTLASEIQYNFKSYHLLARYNFMGNTKTHTTLYGLLGGGLVIAKYDENIKEDYDKTVYTTSSKEDAGRANGLTINVGVGGEYKISLPSIFIEAGAAIPAHKTSNAFIQNNIPFHFICNAGIKIPIGHK